MNIEYERDSDGYDVRYVNGQKHGRVPFSNLCDEDTEYVARYVVDEDENGKTRWQYRQPGSDHRNVDDIIRKLSYLPDLDHGQYVQILVNFGRVEETFDIVQAHVLYGPDQAIPVFQLEGYKERTLSLRFQDDLEYPVIDSEPAARGQGLSPTDIEPVLFKTLLQLLDNSDAIGRWDEAWEENTEQFDRGEFYHTIYSPLLVAYSIIDEELVELVNRYYLARDNNKELSNSFIHCGFDQRLDHVSSLLSQEEYNVISEAWNYRNDLAHGIHSQFGVKLRHVDFEQLTKQILFAILKIRTLNTYVNSAQYRVGAETPEEAVQHLINTTGYDDAIEAARRAVKDKRSFKRHFFTTDDLSA